MILVEIICAVIWSDETKDKREGLLASCLLSCLLPLMSCSMLILFPFQSESIVLVDLLLIIRANKQTNQFTI